MTPQEIFNTLMKGEKVKLTNEKFQELYRDYKKESNEFEIYQIEQHSVNLYFSFNDEVVYDIQYEDIFLF